MDFLAQPLLILGIISTFSIPQAKKLKVLLLPALRETEGIVSIHEEKRHGFQDGDTVTFREVEGMTQVNGK